jgi:ribosomal protein RSM22 (predicted rRNA methylase)
MTPFQGKEPARLSALLLEILDRLEREHCGAGIRQRARAVAELSRLFTKGRHALGTDYLSDPALAAAYLTYFFPVNLSKIQVLLDELPEDWHISPGGEALRVLDVGAGPGTGAIAVLDWLRQRSPDHLERLTVAAVDASAEALRQARRLWTAYSRALDMNNASLVVLEGNLARSGTGEWHANVVRNGPYDLIIAANCLNELFPVSKHPIKERSEVLVSLLTQLAPHGTLMIVEPALRETSRALHQVRDQLLAEKRCTVYSPCLHENNCPALVNPDDWCHEERAWEPPIMIHQIDREVGFIKDALKFSYLLLRNDGRTITDRSPDTFRMVSELRKLKGDTRAWLCNELGRSEVGRLDRALSTGNSAWDHCDRGTIVQIEGLTRKEGATLARIPPEGTVEIVRPI